MGDFKIKITACENYQTIETDYFEPLDFEDMTYILKELRKCIKDATSDIAEKQASKVKVKTKNMRKATPNQLRYLEKLGYNEDTGELTFEEASELITEYGG